MIIHPKVSRSLLSAILMLRNGLNNIAANTIAAAIDPVKLTVTPKRFARITTTATKASGSSPRQLERAKSMEANTASIALRTVPNATRIGIRSRGDIEDSCI